MGISTILPLFIILITCIVSYSGFANNGQNQAFRRLCFNVGAILKNREWDRMITSAFLHGDWMHLIFNMLTFWFFAPTVIYTFGIWIFLLIYFGSILGGGLLALFTHRSDYYYTAIGASGGVVGVLFAVIASYPLTSINIMFIPFDIPAWIFGVGYLCFSIYAMQKSMDNVGHDAHLGGAIVGLLLAVVCLPLDIVLHNGIYILANVVPILILIYMLYRNK